MRFAIVASLVGVLSIPANATAVERIRLGTLAPRGSTWETLLKEMGQKWQEASDGKVRLLVYAGGVMGNEGDMVNKTRIGELQAVALTTVGLHDIAPDPQAVDVPMMIDDSATLDFVMQRLAPALERALDAKGYVVLNWSEIGFVRFFSTHRYDSMAGFSRHARMFGWDGDPGSIAAWRAAGFNPTVISSTDIMPALQTGLIDTVAFPPLYALTSRVFEKAKYMLDLRWAVLTGATVVRKDAWLRIPAEMRPRLLDIAHEYGQKMDAEARRLDADATTTMKQQGLVVVEPIDRAPFEAAARAAQTVIRGKVVPAGVFDDVKKLVGEAHAAAH